MNQPTQAMDTPAGVRAAARRRDLRSPTSGTAPGHVQANLVVVPARAAADFARFVERNPQACPLIEAVPPGGTPMAAGGSTLWSDLPRYRVFERGRPVVEALDVEAWWRPDLVAFLLGCSFTFDHLLLDEGLSVRHVEGGTNAPMYITNRACEPAGAFAGPLVVSMRPLPLDQVDRAVSLTAAYPQVHGAPVAVGAPDDLGIADLDRPDFGDVVEVRPGEVPVFWACGVTPQLAVEQAQLALAITHAPGHMFVTDLAVSELRSVSLPLRGYDG